MNKALEKSILHWTKLFKGEESRFGRDMCACCTEYWRSGCRSCPIYKKTNKTSCLNTPYSRLAKHVRDRHFNVSEVKATCLTCKRLIKNELDFLKSLREI
jgi:hypothetical protein